MMLGTYSYSSKYAKIPKGFTELFSNLLVLTFEIFDAFPHISNTTKIPIKVFEKLQNVLKECCVFYFEKYC